MAASTGISRRAADKAIGDNRVKINGQLASLGQQVDPRDSVEYDGQQVTSEARKVLIMLNKPRGFVVSREGQGARTIYDLLPGNFKSLKPVGRIDKDSSGLILLTNDGLLANKLTHPSFTKKKIYRVILNKDLSLTDADKIKSGVKLDDGLSKLEIRGGNKRWQVIMNEGRNRQIRRTFEKLGYRVTDLHRTDMGDFHLGDLRSGHWNIIEKMT